MDEELLKPEVKITESGEQSEAESLDSSVTDGNTSDASSPDSIDLEEESESSQEDTSFDEAQIKLAQSILGERFEVLDVIGQGGMGSVYRVKDIRSEQVVALKLLKPELCKDKSARKRFTQEAEALSVIDNDNIVSVYDYGVTESGTPYLVMQYLEGGSLDEKLESKEKLEVDETIDIALDVCSALDYAHEKKLVHRDIKPSNVMITKGVAQEKDKAHLADFGIAKLLRESESKTTQLTQTGDFFGTPAYMSPEQCEGTEVDNRSDIYSLGCLLYKMVTGTVPFEGLTPVQMAVKHISAEPPRFARDRPDGDPLLSMQEIILKCMRKDKLERYQSIGELVEDLQAIKAGKVVGYTYDEIGLSKPGLITWVKKASLAIFGLFGGIVSLCWYCMLISCLGSAATESYSSSFSMIAGISLVAILFLVRPTYEILKSIKKRASLGDWSVRLLILCVSLSYLSATVVAIPKLIHPFSDIGMIMLMFSTTSTVVIYLFCLLRLMSVSLSRTGIAIFDFVCGVFNRSHKKFKHRSVPIRMRSALFRISLVMIIFFPAWMAMFPDSIGGAVSGFSQMDQKFNGTFAEPLMKLSTKLPGEREQRIALHANLIAKRGEKDRALSLLNQHLAKTPNDREMLFSKAAIEKDKGNIRQALTDINRAVKLYPDNAECLLLRGNLHLALGENEKAIKDFNYAIDDTGYLVGSTSHELYRSRALANYRLKKYEAAIENCDRLIETGIRESKDYLLRALVYNAMGERKKANLNLNDAVHAYSSSESGNDYLIKAYAAKHLGQEDEYKSNLEKAQEKGAKKDQITKSVFGDLPMVQLEW